MRILFKDFRIVDIDNDFCGSIVVENGFIKEVCNNDTDVSGVSVVIDGRGFSSSTVLMPAFIDLHAHFRESGFPEKETSFPKETLESASLAAVAGGFVTAVCMANTSPVIDSLDKVLCVRNRSGNLGLIDLYPVLSLTKNMDGQELSDVKKLSENNSSGLKLPLMISEDGKDVADDNLFLEAMTEAKRLGIPVSCHCDFYGDESKSVRRVIELGKKAGCHIHIAHVSTKETVEIIREEKKQKTADNGFFLSCEATLHHIGATEEDAQRMGDKSYGRVNPSLSSEENRQVVIAALKDGTIDAIATDHAPHSEKDKAAGSPGFVGLETAFAVCFSNLSVNLNQLSALMSANPAWIIGLKDRGRIKEGLRADLVIADTKAEWPVLPEKFKSRGKCTPFANKVLKGKILMTINAGKIVFDGGANV